MPEIPEIPDIEDVPDIPEPSPFDSYVDTVSTIMRPVTQFIWSLVQSFALAAVAVLVLLFLPQQTERVTDVVQEHPVSAGGLGILTVILAGPLMAVTAVTIILIPATILIAIALVLGIFFGIISVGSEIGRRMADGFGQSWKRPMQTAAGTFAIAFLASIFSIANWGWLTSLIWLLIGGIGLGSVMMTRFGTRSYQPASATVAAPAEGEAEVSETPAEVEEVPEEKPKPDSEE
jgi:hypothetical protein